MDSSLKISDGDRGGMRVLFRGELTRWHTDDLTMYFNITSCGMNLEPDKVWEITLVR